MRLKELEAIRFEDCLEGSGLDLRWRQIGWGNDIYIHAKHRVINFFGMAPRNQDVMDAGYVPNESVEIVDRDLRPA